MNGISMISLVAPGKEIRVSFGVQDSNVLLIPLSERLALPVIFWSLVFVKSVTKPFLPIFLLYDLDQPGSILILSIFFMLLTTDCILNRWRPSTWFKSDRFQSKPDSLALSTRGRLLISLGFMYSFGILTYSSYFVTIMVMPLVMPLSDAVKWWI